MPQKLRAHLLMFWGAVFHFCKMNTMKNALDKQELKTQKTEQQLKDVFLISIKNKNKNWKCVIEFWETPHNHIKPYRTWLQIIWENSLIIEVFQLISDLAILYVSGSTKICKMMVWLWGCWAAVWCSSLTMSNLTSRRYIMALLLSVVAGGRDGWVKLGLITL